MTLNTPHEFVPQTLQTISSVQVDQNFAAIESWGNALENQVLGSQGNQDTITSQKTFTQWPLCTSVATLPQNGLVTRAVMDLLLPIGHLLWLAVPKLPPVQYGIEFKWPNGQQLDLATYQALYNYLTQGLSPITAGVGIVAGSSPQRFTMPDITGSLPQIANTLGGLGANRITGGRSDMTNLSTPCGIVGSQGFLLENKNLPTGTMVRYDPDLFGRQSYAVTTPGAGVSIGESGNRVAKSFTPTAAVLYPAMRVL